MKLIKKRKIESTLKNIGNNTPAIDLEAIKKSHPVIPCAETGLIYKNTPRQILPKKRSFAYAMCILLSIVILAGIPVGAISYNNNNTTELYIDTEVSVKLVIGPFGRVRSAILLDEIDAEAENTAAAFQYSGKTTLSVQNLMSFAVDTVVIDDTIGTLADLKGRKVDEAVDSVIDYLSENGMLPEGCEVIISTVGKNNKRAGEIAEKARNAALLNKKAMLSERAVTVLENMKEKIKNISPAKLKYLKEALGVDTGYTEEELKNFSAGYLRYLVKLAKSDDGDLSSISNKAKNYYAIYIWRMNNKNTGESPGNSENSKGNSSNAQNTNNGNGN